MHRLLATYGVLLATATALATTQASTTASTPTTTLPPGYKYFAATGSAYKFHHERHLSWYDANTTCAGEGAHLVVLNDAEEMDIVSRFILDDGGEFYYTWTGLYDNRPGGAMRWITVLGEPLIDVYHVWYYGYPRNDDQRRCVNFGSNNKKLYNDWTCDYTLYFTCERAQ